MLKEKLLISGCLLGELVKYDGDHNLLEKSVIEKLQERYILHPFCPEVEGGLSIPRVPCEIISFNPLQVINKNGEIKTKEFLSGAQKALELCKKEHITKALLKENSPSCGTNYIYDGTFTGTKISNKGVSARSLAENNIALWSEKELELLIC